MTDYDAIIRPSPRRTGAYLFEGKSKSADAVLFPVDLLIMPMGSEDPSDSGAYLKESRSFHCELYLQSKHKQLVSGVLLFNELCKIRAPKAEHNCIASVVILGAGDIDDKLKARCRAIAVAPPAAATTPAAVTLEANTLGIYLFFFFFLNFGLHFEVVLAYRLGPNQIYFTPGDHVSSPKKAKKESKDEKSGKKEEEKRAKLIPTEEQRVPAFMEVIVVAQAGREQFLGVELASQLWSKK